LDGQVENINSILKGCLKWDRLSQKELYQLFHGYGMSIALRYADDRDEAVDILNECFLKVFTQLSRFDLNRPFKPWFRQILVNTAISRYRQKLKRFHTEEIDGSHEPADTENILSGISYKEVIQLLQRVSPSYRTVFNLYVLEGFSHDEISKMLEISIGASKSNLFKAREQLKRLLTQFLLT